MLITTDPAMMFALGYAGLLAGVAILSVLRGRPGRRTLAVADGFIRLAVAERKAD